MTLVELLIALTVMAIISSAAFSIVLAATNNQRYGAAQQTAIGETELAWHRLLANGRAALSTTSFPIPAAAPVISTDANGQSRLTLNVPDVTNATTRTIVYSCTGSSPPYTLVESDPRYNVAGTPCILAHNVTAFTATLGNTNGQQIWIDLQVAPSNTGFPIRRHFCIDCRNF